MDIVKEIIRAKVLGRGSGGNSGGGDSGDVNPLDAMIEGSITEVKSNATKVRDNSFQFCSSLTAANFPAATSIGGYSFYYCSNLTTVNFPAATSIGSNAFKSCGALAAVDFPVATRIDDFAFQTCSALTALILRSETKATLSSTRAFTSTPIASGTGYIYVPRALLSDTDSTKDYRQASNWSTYAAQFRALEDYTVDGTTTGALDESKI